MEQARQILDEQRPDIILEEAVGSCTDLSATVYQPLRKYYRHKFDLAPLTILVEPERILSRGLLLPAILGLSLFSSPWPHASADLWPSARAWVE